VGRAIELRKADGTGCRLRLASPEKHCRAGIGRTYETLLFYAQSDVSPMSVGQALRGIHHLIDQFTFIAAPALDFLCSPPDSAGKLSRSNLGVRTAIPGNDLTPGKLSLTGPNRVGTVDEPLAPRCAWSTCACATAAGQAHSRAAIPRSLHHGQLGRVETLAQACFCFAARLTPQRLHLKEALQAAVHPRAQGLLDHARIGFGG